MANPIIKTQHAQLTTGAIPIANNIGPQSQSCSHLHPEALGNDHYHSCLSPSSSCSSNKTLVNSRSFSSQDFKILRTVGKGAQGSVYCAQDRITRKSVALKVVSKVGKTGVYIRALLAEQNTLSLLHSDPWFVSLLASWSDSHNFYLAMEMHPSTLSDLIFQEGKLKPARAQFYMAEIIVAVTFLHYCGIIHRDVKPANILLSRKGHIVLGDFGFVKDFHQVPSLEERSFQPYWPYLRTDVPAPTTPCRPPSQLTFVVKGYCGTPVHMAPEILIGQPYAFGVDFWAAAITLFQMLTGRVPWNSDDPCEIKTKVMYSTLEISEGEMDHNAEDFLRKMLRRLPSHRLHSGSDMYNHPYFGNIDWFLISKQAVPIPTDWLPALHPPQSDLDHLTTFLPGELYDNSSNMDPYPQFCWTPQKVMKNVEMKAVYETKHAEITVSSVGKPRLRSFKRLMNKIKNIGPFHARRKRLAPVRSLSVVGLPPTPNPSAFSCSYSDSKKDR